MDVRPKVWADCKFEMAAHGTPASVGDLLTKSRGLTPGHANRDAWLPCLVALGRARWEAQECRATAQHVRHVRTGDRNGGIARISVLPRVAVLELQNILGSDPPPIYKHQQVSVN